MPSAGLGPDFSETALLRRRTLAGGVFWVGFFRWSAQLLSWAVTLLVIRILSPEDYGILGMTTFFIGIMTVLAEFGLGSAILAVPAITRPMARQLNSVALGVGLGTFILLALAAWPISVYFRVQVLVPVVLVMGLGLVVDTLRTVPVALLSRELHYRSASSVDFVRAISASFMVLILALLGARFWALVGGMLAGSVAAALWALWLKPVGYERPTRALGEPVRMSSHLLVSRVAWQAYQNADFLVAGRLLGAVQLGFYNVGWTIASLPGEKLTTIVTAATAPFFASIRQDTAALRAYFLRLTYLLCLVLWPILFGFVLVADLLVPAVLGAKWAPAVPVARALVLYTALQSPMTLNSQILMVTGRTRLSMTVALVALVVLPPSFYVSGKLWGIEGIAWTWAVMYPVINAWPLLATLRQLDARVTDHLKILGKASLFVAGMSAAVVLVRVVLPEGARIRFELPLAVLTGVVSYSLLLWLGAREALDLLAEAFRSWRAGVRAAVSSNRPAN
jgi:PST family polysaccharide transporter